MYFSKLIVPILTLFFTMSTFLVHASENLLRKFHYTSSATLISFQERTSLPKAHTYEGMLLTEKTPQFSSMNIPFRYYKAQADGPRPLVMVFPTALGFFPFESSLADYFTKRGVSVLIILSHDDLTSYDNQIDQLDSIIVESTVKVRHLIDWAESPEQRQEIDREKIGVLGVSLGGIRASILMGADPRPKAAVIFIVGGNIPEILTYSNFPSAITFRQRALKNYGLPDKQDLLKKLQSVVTLDPLVLAPLRSSRDYYMVIAGLDTIVPTKNQWELWEAVGRPEYLYQPLGHIFSGLTYPLMYKQFLNFFQNRWNN